MAGKFLTAVWSKLIMANYVVDKKIFNHLIPNKTEIDFWNDRCYASLVGFMFLNTRLKGIKIPFHSNFEEVNLRFYVKHKAGNEWKRGVVFVKEIVPKPALTFVANKVYGEKYETLPMNHIWQFSWNRIKIEYSWRKNGWHKIAAVADHHAIEISPDSEEEFFTEHFWGYTKINDQVTSEYQVEHPRWRIYPVTDYQVEVDFGLMYGNDFAFFKP